MAEQAGTEEVSPPVTETDGRGDEDDDDGGSEAILKTLDDEVRGLRDLNVMRFEGASEGTNDLQNTRLTLLIFLFF